MLSAACLVAAFGHFQINLLSAANVVASFDYFQTRLLSAACLVASLRYSRRVWLFPNKFIIGC